MVSKPDNSGFRALRDVLADIYPTEADARRVSADAGLNLALIDFEASSLNRWQEILDEARKQNKSLDVMAIASRDYADYETLQQAIELYRRLSVAVTAVDGTSTAARRTPLRLFPGMVPYGTDDAAVFFGRDQEIENLAARIRQDPIVVVNGLSGCGKSSLMRAGVVPRMLQEGRLVIYTNVYENIQDDVRRAVAGSLRMPRETSQDFVALIEDYTASNPDGQLVLIVDQVEQAFGSGHDPRALEAFVRGISRLVGAVERRTTVVIVLRSDLFYYLESSLRRLYSSFPLYQYLFTLDPLTREAARQAIVSPLQAYDIPFDTEVVEEILSALVRSSVGTYVGPTIQPIQLQIVLRSLVATAGEGTGRLPDLRAARLQELGGVQKILQNYLVNAMGDRAEAWRLLARFVSPDYKTGQAIRRSELLAVPAFETIETEIRFLLGQGFIEAYEVQDNEVYYRLAHDYLVNAIIQHINEHPADQIWAWTLAESWLASGTVEWKASAQAAPQSELLLEKARYEHILRFADRLRLNDDGRRLLVLTALHYGDAALGYWLSRDGDMTADLDLVVGRLLAPDAAARAAARTSLTRSVHPAAKSVVALNDEARKAIKRDLVAALQAPAVAKSTQTALSGEAAAGTYTDHAGDIRAVHEQAARALWILRPFDSNALWLRVAGLVARVWVRDHAPQIASYFLTSLLVVFALGAFLFAQNRLRGSWARITSLSAGATPLVAVDPADETTLYALTMANAGSSEGSSLFARTRGQWTLVNRDFTKSRPTALLAVPSSAGTRLFVTLYGKGVLRSDDGGNTWEVANRGLPSHGLTAMAFDPDNPSTLFVSTDDWRGVLVSTTGGNEWDYYDYQGEIYGAAITRLVYTRANGGLLIAGTVDGRILVHSRDDPAWHLQFGISKGAITAFDVARPAGQTVYAGTSQGIVIRSQDGGMTWEVLGQVSDQFNITGLAVSLHDPQMISVSTYGNGGYTIWQSSDGGQDWAPVRGLGLARSELFSLVAAGQQTEWLFAGTSDGLFASSDGGSNWQKEALTSPLASIEAIAVSAGAAAPVYVATGGSMYVNADGKLDSWQVGTGVRAEEVRTVVVSPLDPHVAYAGVLLLGEWSTLITRDGGRSWQTTSPPPIEPVVPDTTALAVATSSDGRTVLYAGTVGCGVFRSTDDGRSWDTGGRARCTEHSDSNMPSDVEALAVDSRDPGLVYAASGQRIYVSRDGGRTWTYRQPPISYQINVLAADPVTPQTVYMTAGADGFWASSDGGASWQTRGQNAFAGAELTAMAAVPQLQGHLIVGTATGGVWTTQNGGTSWQFLRENLAIGRITGLVTSAGLDGGILIGSLSDGIATYTPGSLFGRH